MQKKKIITISWKNIPSALLFFISYCELFKLFYTREVPRVLHSITSGYVPVLVIEQEYSPLI